MQTIEQVEKQKEVWAAPQPNKWRIVAHADIHAGGALIWTLVHVIRFHAGISVGSATAIARRALHVGRATVKDGLTKEVAETIMYQIEKCRHVQTATRFAFKLEQH